MPLEVRVIRDTGDEHDLEAITVLHLQPKVYPTGSVTFEHDDIVPHRSASMLLEHVGSEHAEHLHLMGGHVGAMVSSSASKKLWPRMRAFWAAHDGQAGTQDSPSRSRRVAPSVPE